MTNVILCCVIGALAGWIYHLVRERKYWKDHAMAESRKRLDKDDDARAQYLHDLAELRRENAELQTQIATTRNINRNLLEQLGRRTGE